ncbi:MAG: AI-2E family transporter [Rhodospirillales bacterium]|nr:AI-2E family transporter [Rhodospirillales bacterium]
MTSTRFMGWLAGFAVFCVLLFVLRGVLMPFVAGMLVAYFLDPVADRLEKAGCSRTIAVVIITGVFFLALATLIVLLIPILQAQITGFIGRLPAYFGILRGHIEPLVERLAQSLPGGELDQLRSALGAYAGNVVQWVGGIIRRLWSGGMALLNILSLVIITPLVAFYLLLDWDHMVARIDGLIPRSMVETVRGLAREIDSTLSAFVRGQATVCLLLGIFYAIGLTLVGLDFGLIIGLGTGTISFVPYFGMAIGLVAGMGLAFAQFSDWVPIALVAAVFAAGQVIEGNFLTPRMVGEKVGLHPVWVIFAVLAGGALFGFTGVLLSIPAAACIGVLVRFAVSRYQQSAVYGDGGEDPS